MCDDGRRQRDATTRSPLGCQASVSSQRWRPMRSAQRRHSSDAELHKMFDACCRWLEDANAWEPSRGEPWRLLRTSRGRQVLECLSRVFAALAPGVVALTNGDLSPSAEDISKQPAGCHEKRNYLRASNRPRRAVRSPFAPLTLASRHITRALTALWEERHSASLLLLPTESDDVPELPQMQAGRAGCPVSRIGDSFCSCRCVCNWGCRALSTSGGLPL